ncbi:hypothetical protein [Saccharopolyspora sp. ASAGF58]|uniref:hypothetical protein n=1 Tax=Saccharopolyspora sp. ASAGF58 TaxID=2719023 RepID=UPI00143FF06B|nr:hypothetical protein [Saccharopolyspora sp. ASAGF58]QIZ36539.1 hypothetical protein FDZ84_20035 [Saccharopolyspora sp. ASAGF58]
MSEPRVAGRRDPEGAQVRIRKDLRYGSRGDHATTVQDRYGIGDLGDQIDLVLHEDDSLPGSLQFPDDVEDQDAARGVQL